MAVAICTLLSYAHLSGPLGRGLKDHPIAHMSSDWNRSMSSYADSRSTLGRCHDVSFAWNSMVSAPLIAHCAASPEQIRF